MPRNGKGAENGQSTWALLLWLQVVCSVPICRTFFMRLHSSKLTERQSLSFQLTQPSAAFLWKEQWDNCYKSKATKGTSHTATRPHFIFTKQIYLLAFPSITRHLMIFRGCRYWWKITSGVLKKNTHNPNSFNILQSLQQRPSLSTNKQFYNDILEVLTLASLVLKMVSNYLEKIKGGCPI